jgi:glucose-1-phosphate thymidylyltransferase
LVIAGDNLFNAGLGDFIAFARRRSPCVSIGVYRLKNRKDAVKYGVVMVDKDAKIVDFQEKPKRPKSSLVAMCLYYIPKERLGLIDKYMRIRKGKADAMGKYISWLKAKVKTYAYVFEGKWYDIGDHKYLNAAKRSF